LLQFDKRFFHHACCLIFLLALALASDESTSRQMASGSSQSGFAEGSRALRICHERRPVGEIVLVRRMEDERCCLPPPVSNAARLFG